MLFNFAPLRVLSRWLSLRTMTGLALGLGVVATALQGAAVDILVFGDATSESSHSLSAPSTEVIAGALGQPARRALPLATVDIYGGSLSFTMNVDPVRRNYVTVKLWGADDGDIRMGRLYLYVPVGGVDYQVGYRHEGDYAPLNVTGGRPPLPGRFFYSTTLLPLSMTQGKTSITLKIVSAGRLYGLGAGGPPSGNYQYVMDRPSRGIYRAYTHLDPFLNPTGEVQGAAPVTITRPSPGQEVMASGGTFFNGVTNRINNRLGAAANTTNFGVDDVSYLAKSYLTPGLVSTANPTVVSHVIAVIDAYATANYAGTVAPSSDWGGAFGELGYAMWLLSAQLAPSLDTVANYGASGGNKARRLAWGDMLYASREYGRLNRDGRFITNQGLIADGSIYKANKGLIVLSDPRAFSEVAAQRYLREACGLQPWLGSDLPAGGSSLKYGSSYYQVTSKGLTREHGYVGNSYGEMAFHAARFYEMTGDTAFRDQAKKMSRARAAFRRPSMEISGGNFYRTMEAIGLLAWRGVGESDGEFADAIVYGDTTEWARGLHLAAITLDPALIGYAKQMLADNQYFVALTRDSRYYADIAALEAFGDYTIISATPDTGTRLPMTEGQPDFAWADEEDRIVALRHGTDHLWIAPFWQAKSGSGINGIARFHYSSPTYDQYGVLETIPQFTFGGSFVRPANYIDKPEAIQWGPPNPPTQAYGNERLPLGVTPAGATDDGPFRGKADFYAFRFGNYLFGLNAHPSNNYTLKTPAGFSGAPELISGGTASGTVTVGPNSTVVLYLPSAVDVSPLPTSPLYVSATGTSAGMNLAWSLSSGATSYTVKRATAIAGPYAVIARGATGTSYLDSTASAGAVYYYQIAAANAHGESYDSMKATGSTLGLPAPWSDTDIGNVTTAGHATFDSGSYAISGAGTDIGGTADGIHFGYATLVGDGTLIARLATRVIGGATNDKVGLMMRESSAANSPMTVVQLDASNGLARFASRATTGGAATTVNGSPISLPVWFKLQRAGNLFTGSVSTNGTTWNSVGSASVSMTNSILIGFAVCSRDATALDTSTFDQVSVSSASTAPTISAQPTSQAAPQASSVTFNVVSSVSTLNYQWAKNGVSITGATGATLTLSNVQAGDAGNYTVTVGNAAGQTTSQAATLTVNPPIVVTPPGSPPVITSDPTSQTVPLGSSASFTVGGTGSSLTYQWLKAGVALAGATSGTLTLTNLQASDAGYYSVVVSNASGQVTSAAARLAVVPSSEGSTRGRIINLSVRTKAGSGDKTLIAGFIISGSGTKPVMVRASGPTLSNFGVSGILSDPRLDLYQGSTVVAQNDSWKSAPNQSAISAAGGGSLGTFALDSKEAIILNSLQPTAYTAIVSSADGGTGVALVEVYDTDTAQPGTPEFDAQPRLINISARSAVGTGDSILIAGFIINGTASKRVMIRASGSTLTNFGIAGVLTNPFLQLYNNSTVIAQNTGWQSAPNAAEFRSLNGDKMGPYSLDPKDSALVVTLAPGAYTAAVRGANDATGVALIEIFDED